MCLFRQPKALNRTSQSVVLVSLSLSRTLRARDNGVADCQPLLAWRLI